LIAAVFFRTTVLTAHSRSEKGSSGCRNLTSIQLKVVY